MLFSASRQKFLTRLCLLLGIWLALYAIFILPAQAQQTQLPVRHVLTVTVGTMITQAQADEQLWITLPIYQSSSETTKLHPTPYMLAICGTEYCGDSLVVYVWQRAETKPSEQGFMRCVAQLALSYSEYHPPKQQSAVLRNDTLLISSELPERATRLTLMYRWNMAQSLWKITGYTMVDSSALTLAQARAELARGRFGAAVAHYQSIAYPEAYYDIQDEAIKMIQSAAEYARNAALRKDFTTAYNVMDTVFATPDGEYFLNYSTLDELLQDFSMLDEPTINFNGFREIIADYALYALRCKYYDRTIELSAYLLNLDATTTTAHLWLADASFAVGEQATARRSYKRYQELMTNTGKQKEIPKRVTDRLK
jgi:hypothetical protein